MDIVTPNFKDVRDIIMSFNTPDRKFVYDVDKGPGWSISIIYNIDADQHMDEFLWTLIPTLEQHLSPTSFSQVFQYDKPILDLLTSTRRVSSYERDHVTNVFASFNNDSKSNPAHSKNESRKIANVWTKRSKNMPQPKKSTNDNTTAPTNPVPPEKPTPPATTVAPPTHTETVYSKVNTQTLAKDDIIALVRETLQTEKSAFLLLADFDEAVKKKIQDNSTTPLDKQNILSVINTETSKLRQEMQTEKEELIGKIDEVQFTLTTELQNVTSPFAQALLAVQQSNQQIIGMLACNPHM